jgi:hypothetical protein
MEYRLFILLSVVVFRENVYMVAGNKASVVPRGCKLPKCRPIAFTFYAIDAKVLYKKMQPETAFR